MKTEIGAYEAKTKLPELLQQRKDPAVAIDRFLAFKEAHTVKARLDIKALIEEGRK